jgi:hypothetical protein
MNKVAGLTSFVFYKGSWVFLQTIFFAITAVYTLKVTRILEMGGDFSLVDINDSFELKEIKSLMVQDNVISISQINDSFHDTSPPLLSSPSDDNDGGGDQRNHRGYDGGRNAKVVPVTSNSSGMASVSKQQKDSDISRSDKPPYSLIFMMNQGLSLLLQAAMQYSLLTVLRSYILDVYKILALASIVLPVMYAACVYKIGLIQLSHPSLCDPSFGRA